VYRSVDEEDEEEYIVEEGIVLEEPVQGQLSSVKEEGNKVKK
jgi:hypothetical protein